MPFETGRFADDGVGVIPAYAEMGEVEKMCCRLFVFCFVVALSQMSQAQVVEFRFDTTNLAGDHVDTVLVGEEFFLEIYTQHVSGFVSETNAGVFAGYLDVAYDSSLASLAGAVVHSETYANVTSADLSVAGLLNNIGGISSSGELGVGLDPTGRDEFLLVSVPFRADAVGTIAFVGSESLSYPQHDVLIYGENEPLLAKNDDSGLADLRLAFGSATLNVMAVPEPSSKGILVITALATLVWWRGYAS